VKGNRGDQDRVRLVISDTGLLENFQMERLDVDRYPWLEGVDADRRPDRLERTLPPDLPGIPEGEWQSIPFEAGHGTFVAGVARSMAPRTSVYVGNHFTMAGAALEYEVISGLDELIQVQAPHVISVPAGAYTRKDLPLLSFSDFRQRYDITLVAAAGNDSTHRPFWPAAFHWAIGVGAFGADEQNLAYFSNHGDWVDVYSLGEGLVNAYATGVYTYQEPPKRPTQQVFRGMARWDGTSLASALVSGLIAAEIARGGGSAQQAWERVFEAAQEVRGVGRYASPW
jgi:subtilisin family serine protease